MFRKYLRPASKLLVRNFSDKAKNDEILQNFLNTKHLRFRNGEKAPMLFSDQEYERRLANLRSLLEIHLFSKYIFQIFQTDR